MPAENPSSETADSLQSDPASLLSGLLSAAGRRQLSSNSRLAYQRTWLHFFAQCAAESLDPRHIPLSEAQKSYALLGDGKGAATLKQIRAALAFAYNHWDLKNPFSKIPPPLHQESQVRYLMPADMRRLLEHLKTDGAGYGGRLAFHLANALFQTACRFDELVQLRWEECQRAGEGIVAFRIKGKGARFQDIPVPKSLSRDLLEWRAFQEEFKKKRIFLEQGIDFGASTLLFAGYSGAAFSNRAFNLRLRAACGRLKIPVITAHGLRHSAATILLNHSKKNLREIQELLRHKNIRTTVRYTHVGYEQTRETAEALSQVLDG
ncbi:MAG: tyrosine recombinase [Chthoniobacteraceae bacterium]|nr:tyrosine recombinase [Chthoniobacteraceae bacterium]